jgi:hypothetical protein
MRYSQKACSTTPVQTATWKPSPTRPPSASAATATLTSSRILGSGIRPTLEDLPAVLRRIDHWHQGSVAHLELTVLDSAAGRPTHSLRFLEVAAEPSCSPSSSISPAQCTSMYSTRNPDANVRIAAEGRTESASMKSARIFSPWLPSGPFWLKSFFLPAEERFWRWLTTTSWYRCPRSSPESAC